MQIFEKNQSSSKGTHLSRQYFSGWHMSSKGSFWTLQQCSRLPNGILSSIFFFFIPYYREITCSQSVLFSFLFFSFLFNHRRKLYHPEQKSEAAVHPLCLVFIFMNCASCLLEWLTPSNSCKHTSHICFHHADYLMYNFNSSCVVEFFFYLYFPENMHYACTCRTQFAWVSLYEIWFCICTHTNHCNFLEECYNLLIHVKILNIPPSYICHISYIAIIWKDMLKSLQSLP